MEVLECYIQWIKAFSIYKILSKDSFPACLSWSENISTWRFVYNCGSHRRMWCGNVRGDHVRRTRLTVSITGKFGWSAVWCLPVLGDSSSVHFNAFLIEVFGVVIYLFCFSVHFSIVGWFLPNFIFSVDGIIAHCFVHDFYGTTMQDVFFIARLRFYISFTFLYDLTV